MSHTNPIPSFSFSYQSLPYSPYQSPSLQIVIGGVDPDKNGNGIKPFAINEMSMLAYYHYLEPTSFYLFPVVPHYPYVLNKHIANLTDFGPYGRQVPGPTGEGIWDPNSWGQFLGMTRPA